MNQERRLVTIVVSPEIEDVFVDWLLERPELERFNTYQVKSYNKNHDDYTLTEKVTGWKRKIAVRVLFPTEVIDDVLTAMRAKFGNTGIYYRITPFYEDGTI